MAKVLDNFGAALKHLGDNFGTTYLCICMYMPLTSNHVCGRRCGVCGKASTAWGRCGVWGGGGFLGHPGLLVWGEPGADGQVLHLRIRGCCSQWSGPGPWVVCVVGQRGLAGWGKG